MLHGSTRDVILVGIPLSPALTYVVIMVQHLCLVLWNVCGLLCYFSWRCPCLLLCVGSLEIRKERNTFTFANQMHSNFGAHRQMVWCGAVWKAHTKECSMCSMMWQGSACVRFVVLNQPACIGIMSIYRPLVWVLCQFTGQLVWYV
jgi:hypothetical protein